MSEFEKELEKNMKSGKVAHERESLYSDFLVSKRDIERIFEDWQPPKPREIPVEIPRCVADWYEDRMVASFLSVVSAYSFSDDEDIKWVRDNGGLDLLCKMKLYGYTIEKEQMFYLREKNTDYYLTKSKNHSFLKLVINPYFDENDEFTQSEIDELNIGSYEQIQVKVEEAGK